MIKYRLELGNKIRDGRAVGNLYLVRGFEVMPRGGERSWTVTTYEDERKARKLVAQLNALPEPPGSGPPCACDKPLGTRFHPDTCAHGRRV